MTKLILFILILTPAFASEKQKGCPQILLEVLTQDEKEFDYDTILIEEPVEAESPRNIEEKPLAKIKLKRIQKEEK